MTLKCRSGCFIGGKQFDPIYTLRFLFCMELSRELRFRVYYGYSPSDYISIPESQLERAEYAWRKKAVFSYAGKQVVGSEFKRIEEDYRYYTGWFDNYFPKDGDDFAQIEKDMPKRSLFQERIALAQNRVLFAMKTGRENLLGTPEELDKLLLS